MDSDDLPLQEDEENLFPFLPSTKDVNVNPTSPSSVIFQSPSQMSRAHSSQIPISSSSNFPVANYNIPPGAYGAPMLHFGYPHGFYPSQSQFSYPPDFYNHPFGDSGTSPSFFSAEGLNSYASLVAMHQHQLQSQMYYYQQQQQLQPQMNFSQPPQSQYVAPLSRELNLPDVKQEDSPLSSEPALLPVVSSSSGKVTGTSFPELEGTSLKLIEEVGKGSFSTVFKAIDTEDPAQTALAIKRLHTTSSPIRVYQEIKLLKLLGGKCYVPELLGCLMKNGQISLILPYFQADSFSDYFCKMNQKTVRSYMKALFVSLSHLHANQVIHRDIKPSNFLFRLKEQTFMLVDFGLAHIGNSPPSSRAPTGLLSLQNKKQTFSRWSGLDSTTLVKQAVVRGGTRGFRAPEVLMRLNEQSTAIDMWSAGVILLCILSGRYPFFNAPDDLTAFMEIAALIGTEPLQEAAERYGKEVKFPCFYKPNKLQSLCLRLFKKRALGPLKMADEVYDLLNRLLDPDPARRITADQALKHSFITGEKKLGISDSV